MMGEPDRWVVRNALRRLGQRFGVRKPEPIDDLFKSGPDGAHQSCTEQHNEVLVVPVMTTESRSVA
jgi:hypothetical protein